MLPTWVVAFLAVMNAGILAWHFRGRRNYLLLSSLLPRLYLCGLYVYFGLFSPPLEARIAYVRWGIGVLLLIDAINLYVARLTYDHR